MSDHRQEVIRVAEELYRQGPDWVAFFREVLGVEGLVRRLYNTPDSLASFEQTEEYQQIQLMLAKLREKGDDSNSASKEPTRVITVRLPKSLHESLRVEAHGRHTSMNKLCISKLLQIVDDELVPADVSSNAAAAVG